MFIQGHVKEDSRKKRMYVCVGVTLVYIRNLTNIVNQLHFLVKKKIVIRDTIINRKLWQCRRGESQERLSGRDYVPRIVIGVGTW